MADLTDKQKRFIEEYAVDLNAARAAIRAGYSENYARKRGWQLAREPKIRERIDETLAELSKRMGVDAERVIRELGRVAFVSAAGRDRFGRRGRDGRRRV
jgi:phage terminase small subunit